MFCGGSIETIMHLLKNCIFVKAIWFAIFGIRVDAGNIFSLMIFLCQLQKWAMFEQPYFLLACLLLLERIWKVRNEDKLQGK